MDISSFSSELYRGFLLRHNKHRTKNNNSFRSTAAAHPQPPYYNKDGHTASAGHGRDIPITSSHPNEDRNSPQRSDLVEAGYLDADTLFGLVYPNMQIGDVNADNPHADKVRLELQEYAKTIRSDLQEYVDTMRKDFGDSRADFAANLRTETGEYADILQTNTRTYADILRLYAESAQTDYDKGNHVDNGQEDGCFNGSRYKSHQLI